MQLNNSLFRKLGLKAKMEVSILYAHENYNDLITEIAEQLIFQNNLSVELDFIHFFTNSIFELKKPYRS